MLMTVALLMAAPDITQEQAQRQAALGENTAKLERALQDWKVCLISTATRFEATGETAAAIADGALGQCEPVREKVRAPLSAMGMAQPEIDAFNKRGEALWKGRLIAGIMDNRTKKREKRRR